MKEIVVQKSWNDNLAAILATFCKYYNIKISQTTIYKLFCDSQKMQDFNRIQNFANTYAFEFYSGFFDTSNIKNLNFPILALVKGYRTVIVTNVSDTITYLDALTGENNESIEEFTSYATGHYFYLNPKSGYKVDKKFEQLVALEKGVAKKKQWFSPEVVELNPYDLMTDFKTHV